MDTLAFWILLILFSGICIGIGIIIGTERMRKAVEDGSIGHLRIDRSEPDEPPKAFLEIANGNTINGIARKNFVILKVVDENYISRD